MESRFEEAREAGTSTERIAMHFGCLSTAMFMNVVRWGWKSRRGEVDLATKYLRKNGR